MRLLLIRGSGFIGPHVANSLMRSGHDVTIFHRGRNEAPLGARVIVGDRRRLSDSARELRDASPDVVIDLVLSSGAQARELMTVFRGAASRVVALSSADVYRACGVLHGSEPGGLQALPLTESSALRTTLQTYPAVQIQRLQQIFGWLDDDYDKIPVERQILGDLALPGTVLRLPMVYGPGDPLHRLFPIVKRIADRRPAILFAENIGAWRSPRGYVENVAAAIALAAGDDRAAGRIYNVAERDCMSEMEWTKRIADVDGWDGELVALPADRAPAHLRMPGNYDQHWIVDSTRIREELGYREIVTNEEAIRRTVAWERANPPAIDTASLGYDADDAALARQTGGASSALTSV